MCLCFCLRHGTLAEGDKGEINGRGGRAAMGRRQCGVIKPAPCYSGSAARCPSQRKK